MRYLVISLVITLFITACGANSEDATTAPQTTDTPLSDIQNISPTPETDLAIVTPTIDPTLRSTLEMQYDELQAAQIAIESVWSDLQTGESVACADELPFLPAPQNYEDDHPVADFLYSAAISLDTAYSLWKPNAPSPRRAAP